MLFNVGKKLIQLNRDIKDKICKQFLRHTMKQTYNPNEFYTTKCAVYLHKIFDDNLYINA